MAESGAPAAAMQPWRERLVAANGFMRYDYAWKDAEFKQAEQRLTGVGCRLLYLHASWVETFNHVKKMDYIVRNKVFIESNNFSPFGELLSKSVALMGYQPVQDADQADLVFVYIPPPADRVDDESMYRTFQKVVKASGDKDPDDKPMFCFLLGDADFLQQPKTQEEEDLRGLSDFAISQEFAPIANDAGYGSVANFAVEFVPPQTENLSKEFQEEKTRKLDAFMESFGCVGQNLMHHTEKWEFYAPSESVFCHGEDDLEGVTHPSEEDTMFWFRETKGKTCDQCHIPGDKLHRCARCRDALYCSRECQKAAWRLHKQLCGKTAEEIQASNEPQQ